MPPPAALERKSAARIAFDRYLRTGDRTLPPAALELKFNPNHDERGRFASAPGVGALKPIRGYPETGKDAWRKANDAFFVRAAAEWNAANHLKPGDPRFMDPQFMKAWAMVESGGNRQAFLTDPFQVNKRGDWDPLKMNYGLIKGQVMTPDISAQGALGWLDYKSHKRTYVGQGLIRHIVVKYIGIRKGPEDYNMNRNLDKNGQAHFKDYTNSIFALAEP